MTMLAELVDVVIGVDTHKRTHTAAVVSAATTGVLEELTIDTDPNGYAELVAMADRHAALRAWSIEGTGTYGAGLARYLAERGEVVIEVDRPKRPKRRNGAKSDRIDAVRAGREALGRTHLAQPRSEGDRAALAVLLTVRRSAVDASRVAQQQLCALVIAAPEPLRDKFRGQSTKVMIATAARLRSSKSWDVETAAYATALRDLGQRIKAMQAEAKDHEQSILAIVRSWRPELLDQLGVGAIGAGVVLCAWSHAGRFRNEAAFATLAGVAPIDMSSGENQRHRLNPFGDRQLNRVLHLIAVIRLQHDPGTQAYAERRRAEGKTDREIKRCLKRYIARQLFRLLENPPPQPLDAT